MSEGLEGEKGILSELPDISCMLMKYRKHGLCQLKLVTLSFDRTLLLLVSHLTFFVIKSFLL